MTEYHFFSGKGKWARLIQPDTRFEPTGIWSVMLYPDEDSLNRIMKLKENTNGVAGILNRVMVDEDGKYVVFKRKAQRIFKGQVKAFSPPEILDKDGNPMPNLRIGNGSDLTLKIEVYTFTNPMKTKGRAARLAAVRVDNLVTFEKESFSDEQKKLVEGLAEQPAQLF